MQALKGAEWFLIHYMYLEKPQLTHNVYLTYLELSHIILAATLIQPPLPTHHTHTRLHMDNPGLLGGNINKYNRRTADKSLRSSDLISRKATDFCILIL
jgi:hypothetical protein